MDLGTAPGDHLVVAQLVGDDTATQVAEFRAAAKAGAPDTVGAASVVAQPGRRKQVGGHPTRGAGGGSLRQPGA